MPDSEELDEILNEIKNINSPKPENKTEEATEFKIEQKEAEEPLESEIAEGSSNKESSDEESSDKENSDEKSSEDEALKEDETKSEESPQDDGALSFDDFENYESEDEKPQVIREEMPVTMPENGDAKKSGGKKGFIAALIAILIIAIAVAAVMIIKNNNEQTTAATQTESQTEETTQAVVSTVNPLTGSADFNSSAVGKRPIACVVENAAAARPQWGIDDDENPPDIIVEGEVEGGETRMLWMYADYTSVPSQIGPMRSARPPYIKFSELFDAIFIHWGMSQTKKGTSYIGANTVFREDNVDHINQMTYSGKVTLFGRDSSRGVSTEHTGVLYGDKIAEAIEDEGFRTDADDSKYTKFSFAEEETTVSDTECTSLSLTFSSRTNTRDWTYSEDDKMYHCTDYETDVTRKNLLILFDETEYISKANYKNSGSAEIYCNYKLSGGEGKLATEGTVVDIKWSVEDGVLVIKDADGNDVNFNVGTTWIGYASSNNGGSVSDNTTKD